MRSIIIPAAGKATRMKPLSRGVSKAMIPVNGRPLISYIINKISEEKDVKEIIIVENELGDISEFVARVYPNLDIKCVVQHKPLGPLHAICTGMTVAEHDKTGITVWLGDTICLDEFDYRDSFLAVHLVEDPHRWCMVDEYTQLFDKPSCEVNTDKALIGIYNFAERDLFDIAIADGMSRPDSQGEYQIAELINAYSSAYGPLPLKTTSKWYDCGELNTYYESKARLLNSSARSFNRIEVDPFYGIVTKSSDTALGKNKIEVEKKWFAKLRPFQALFCPRILDSDEGVLEMSLEPGTALNEVIVYDNLRPEIWREIIRKIMKIHHEVFYVQNGIPEYSYENCFEAYFLKVKSRMDQVWRHLKMEEDESVTDFVLSTGLELCKSPWWSECIHGDSHLGNILYEPYTGSIKFVDPKGSFGSMEGTAGDLRYDMGKLLQDFYCGYAMIIDGRYHWDNETCEFSIDWIDGSDDLLQYMEKELEEYGHDVALLKRLSILLLLTAIPFHEDSERRQRAMYSRALQLIESITNI
jgi:dTDP-glucose pyrophosphorylase